MQGNNPAWAVLKDKDDDHFYAVVTQKGVGRITIGPFASVKDAAETAEGWMEDEPAPTAATREDA